MERKLIILTSLSLDKDLWTLLLSIRDADVGSKDVQPRGFVVVEFGIFEFRQNAEQSPAITMAWFQNPSKLSLNKMKSYLKQYPETALAEHN